MARASGELIADYGIDDAADDLPAPSWNIAPTARIPVIVDAVPRDAGDDAEPRRRLEGARWGLVPTWANDVSVGVRAFNARSETAASKPTFRAAVRSRRAAIPSTGYYEWKTAPDRRKQPYFIHPPSGDLLLAGLYEWWRDPADPDSPWLLSATILTRQAEGHLAGIHDRMPVFLSRDRLDEWLDPATTGDDGLVRAVAEHGADVAATLVPDAVDPRVGNVRENGPELIEPVDA